MKYRPKAEVKKKKKNAFNGLRASLPFHATKTTYCHHITLAFYSVKLQSRGICMPRQSKV